MITGERAKCAPNVCKPSDEGDKTGVWAAGEADRVGRSGEAN